MVPNCTIQAVFAESKSVLYQYGCIGNNVIVDEDLITRRIAGNRRNGTEMGSTIPAVVCHYFLLIRFRWSIRAFSRVLEMHTTCSCNQITADLPFFLNGKRAELCVRSA